LLKIDAKLEVERVSRLAMEMAAAMKNNSPYVNYSLLQVKI
jgi:hypothetical protein